MKGITPVMGTVMLIALATIVGISIYFWAAGQSMDVDVPSTDVVDISVIAVNVTNGDYLVTNTDTEEFSADFLYTTAGDTCNFTGTVTVTAGESAQCNMDTAPTGEIMFYHDLIGPAVVIVG